MRTRNPFYLGTGNYKRNVDPVGHYITQKSFLLSKMFGHEISETRSWIVDQMTKGGQFELTDPRVYALVQQENGDMKGEVITLSHFFEESLGKDRLISPNWCVFDQPTVLESFHSRFMKVNIAKRKVFKKKMFDHEMRSYIPTLTPEERAHEVLQTLINDKFQNNRKTSNNSLSGTYAIGSTPMANPSLHPVLTSVCRSTSGYGNANNEKLIAGNRHYWCPNVVWENITAICSNFDRASMTAVMEKYNLVYPTVEQAMQCIKRGAWKYWRDEAQYEEISVYLSKLEPIERAAFVYIGDLYHLRQFNDSVIRELFTRISVRKTGEDLTPEQMCLAKADPNVIGCAMEIWEDDVAGIKVLDIKDTQDALLRKVTATAMNIEDTIDDYYDFIHVFFSSNNVPASLSYFPDSIRHVALTSDTDSTIFTTQEWVMWYMGTDDFISPIVNAISGFINLFASHTIIHLLSLMSANYGIKEDQIRIIDMKNEFKFDPFVPTLVSKHYMALQKIREGNVIPDGGKKEIKGAAMRNSAAPISLNKRSEQLMVDLMHKVAKGEKVELITLLKSLADLERDIVNSIKQAYPEYLRKGKVKTKDAYGDNPVSPYLNHIFWNSVFGPEYGLVEEPPYQVYTVKLKGLDTEKKLNTWLDNMENRELATRMRMFFKTYNKTSFNSLHIPVPRAENIGLPKEIEDVIDFRGIVRNSMKTFHLILESMNVFIVTEEGERLLMDYY